MKKCATFFLLLTLAWSLCACEFSDSDIIVPVEFYYPRNTESYVYGFVNGVIASETREASGHAGDLDYLLALYLRGPLDSELRSPFPKGCFLMDVTTREGTMTVLLDSSFAALTGMDQTLAGACLAKTCMSLSDVTQVRIETFPVEDPGSVSITFSAESLLLEDDSVSSEPAFTEPQ